MEQNVEELARIWSVKVRSSSNHAMIRCRQEPCSAQVKPMMGSQIPMERLWYKALDIAWYMLRCLAITKTQATFGCRSFSMNKCLSQP